MSHFELLSASCYYGRRSPGWVVLRNGAIVIHGSKSICQNVLAFLFAQRNETI